MRVYSAITAKMKTTLLIIAATNIIGFLFSQNYQALADCQDGKKVKVTLTATSTVQQAGILGESPTEMQKNTECVWTLTPNNNHVLVSIVKGSLGANTATFQSKNFMGGDSEYIGNLIGIDLSGATFMTKNTGGSSTLKFKSKQEELLMPASLIKFNYVLGCDSMIRLGKNTMFSFHHPQIFGKNKLIQQTCTMRISGALKDSLYFNIHHAYYSKANILPSECNLKRHFGIILKPVNSKKSGKLLCYASKNNLISGMKTKPNQIATVTFNAGEKKPENSKGRLTVYSTTYCVNTNRIEPSSKLMQYNMASDSQIDVPILNTHCVYDFVSVRKLSVVLMKEFDGSSTEKVKLKLTGFGSGKMEKLGEDAKLREMTLFHYPHENSMISFTFSRSPVKKSMSFSVLMLCGQTIQLDNGISLKISSPMVPDAMRMFPRIAFDVAECKFTIDAGKTGIILAEVTDIKFPSEDSLKCPDNFFQYIKAGSSRSDDIKFCNHLVATTKKELPSNSKISFQLTKNIGTSFNIMLTIRKWSVSNHRFDIFNLVSISVIIRIAFNHF